LCAYFESWIFLFWILLVVCEYYNIYVKTRRAYKEVMDITL